jgi:transcriptional regulator with XRE-family HTH domain
MAHPLKTFRESQSPKLSQADLAASLGVTRGTIARYENQTRTPRPKEAKRISEHTGISVGDLIEAGVAQ